MANTRPRGGPLWRSHFIVWHGPHPLTAPLRKRVKIKITVSCSPDDLRTKQARAKVGAEFERLLTHVHYHRSKREKVAEGHHIYRLWIHAQAHRRLSAGSYAVIAQKTGIKPARVRRVIGTLRQTRRERLRKVIGLIAHNGAPIQPNKRTLKA